MSTARKIMSHSTEPKCASPFFHIRARERDGNILRTNNNHSHITSPRCATVKYAVSVLYSHLRAAVRGPAATTDHPGPCPCGGLARVVASYRDVDICVSGRDRRDIDSRVIRGRDRV
jgi:hypothetical protein